MGKKVSAGTSGTWTQMKPNLLYSSYLTVLTLIKCLYVYFEVLQHKAEHLLRITSKYHGSCKVAKELSVTLEREPQPLLLLIAVSRCSNLNSVFKYIVFNYEKVNTKICMCLV